MEQITPDTVKHMAKLSRLELSEDEVMRYAKQLSAIIDYASHLPQLADQPDRFVMVASADEPVQTENPHELLRNAVAFENGYVKVPAILDKSES